MMVAPFSPSGGGVQDRKHKYLVEHLGYRKRPSSLGGEM